MLCNFSVFSQNTNIEEVYQNCVYSSLNDKGLELKRHTKKFEEHLIKNRILKDSTAKSYFKLFKILGTSKWKKLKYNYSYIDTINKTVGYQKVNLNSECIKKLRQNKSFEKSKIFKMRKIFANENYSSIELAIKKMSEVLEVKDFESDFYKYRTLFYLEDLKSFYFD